MPTSPPHTQTCGWVLDTVSKLESVILGNLTGYYSVLTSHTKRVGSFPLGPWQRVAVIYASNHKDLESTMADTSQIVNKRVADASLMKHSIFFRFNT